MCHQANQVKAPNAGFSQLVFVMNEKSTVLSKSCQTIDISKSQLNKWFNEQNGQEISAYEKLLDLQAHCDLRKIGLLNIMEYLRVSYLRFVLLMKNGFYRTNRRRNINILKLGPHKNKGDDKILHSKMLSRRFPVKPMFMGVVV